MRLVIPVYPTQRHPSAQAEALLVKIVPVHDHRIAARIEHVVQTAGGVEPEVQYRKKAPVVDIHPGGSSFFVDVVSYSRPGADGIQRIGGFYLNPRRYVAAVERPAVELHAAQPIVEVRDFIVLHLDVFGQVHGLSAESGRAFEYVGASRIITRQQAGVKPSGSFRFPAQVEPPQPLPPWRSLGEVEVTVRRKAGERSPNFHVRKLARAPGFGVKLVDIVHTIPAVTEHDCSVFRDLQIILRFVASFGEHLCFSALEVQCAERNALEADVVEVDRVPVRREAGEGNRLGSDPVLCGNFSGVARQHYDGGVARQRVVLYHHDAAAVEAQGGGEILAVPGQLHLPTALHVVAHDLGEALVGVAGVDAVFHPDGEVAAYVNVGLPLDANGGESFVFATIGVYHHQGRRLLEGGVQGDHPPLIVD